MQISEENKFDQKQNQVTKEWLTSTLAKNGFLLKGNVSFIEQRISKSFGSTFYSLNVKYSQESSGKLPSNLLMKQIKPEFNHLGQKEIDFYRTVKSSNTQFPVVTCYGAEKATGTSPCYLLLEDLTHTHYQTQWPLPPTQEQFKEAIKLLANLHAYWWGHSSFGTSVFKMPSEEGLRQWILKIESQFSSFSDFLGDRLSENRKRLYFLLFDKLTKLLWNRLSSHTHLTLIHGDTHFWNFLFPLNKNEDQCVLVDWQDWEIWLGASDLSYMIALHCYREQRERMEYPLLRFYFEEMQKQNIDYAWNEFWTDYRICVIFNLLIPVYQYSMLDIPPSIWWPHMERGFAALEDLNCLELLS